MREIKPDNLARKLLDACDEDGALDEATGRAIVNEHAQLTIDGREVTTRSLPGSSCTEGKQGPQTGATLRLFPAPATMPGSIAFSFSDLTKDVE
jgi:hypothetical protein